jgi:hypothetical protein
MRNAVSSLHGNFFHIELTIYRLIRHIGNFGYQATKKQISSKIHGSLKDPLEKKSRMPIEAVYYAVWFHTARRNSKNLLFTFVDKDNNVDILEYDSKLMMDVSLTGFILKK